MPSGFEYHWPTERYEDIRHIQNWYVNLETMTLFIYGTGRYYPILLMDNTIYVEDVNFNAPAFKKIYDALTEYAIDNILLG